MSAEEGIEQKDYLYAVLNLPNTASQNEIRERYRALSVIFHPDKQHNQHTTDTAVSKFLDIQKAYEVLSDPFLRQVYDRLGSEALRWKWPTELRSKDSEEIKAILDEWDFDRRHETTRELLHPKASVTCIVNASSLTADGELGPNSRKILDRIHGVGIAGLGFRQRVTTALGPNSTLSLEGYADQKSVGNLTHSSRVLMGTLKHQFSQRLGLELTAGLLKPHLITAKGTYADGENAVVVHTAMVAALMDSIPPWMTLSFGRRLFRHSPTQASVSWTFAPGSLPALDLHLDSSKPFNLTSYEGFAPPTDFVDPPSDQGPGSVTGFGAGVRSWSCGLLLRGLESRITMNYSLFLHELAVRLKAGVEIGFLSAAYSVSAKWKGKRTSFSTAVGVGNLGVFVRFELSYLWQKLTLPIILSPDGDKTMGLYTLIIPSTALALGYLFILRPRRRDQRARYFERARRALKEERTEVARSYENTLLLLREPAKRHMDAERAIGGLVILEAIYAPRSPDNEIAGLDVDVTIPLQALVHNSQLYVSSRIPKSGIQGFYDPTPETPKSLRVRYMFREQMHYAEIPDLVPIVLPLRDHLVM